MARINGINSDFAKQGDMVKPVEPEPANLFMKLFICPYNEPNQLEETGAICSGTNSSCPHEPNKNGHAHVELNQADGIKLGTGDEDQMTVNQNGAIQLKPSSGQNMVVQGNLLIQNPAGTNTLIDASSNRVVIWTNGGGVVTINSNGQIAINGNVTIEGNLTVNGIFTNTPP